MPPEWPALEFPRQARAYGYHGVDLRCTALVNGVPADGGQLTLQTPEAEVAALVDAFAQAGVEIASLLCYNKGGHGGTLTDWDAFAEDVAAHARFAARLGTKVIRVTVGKTAPGVTWEQHLRALWPAVQRGLDAAPGVGAVFENHVGSGSATQLLRLSEEFGDERLGVELSPDHCIVMQEDVLGLVARYARHVHQVCFADRKPVEEGLGAFDGHYYTVRYEDAVPGEGLVPAERMFSLLKEKGFKGYVSLKWEKSANYGHHLPWGDVMLPRFASYMRALGVID
jgi:sugar phosphate isomerase/epimerase